MYCWFFKCNSNSATKIILKKGTPWFLFEPIVSSQMKSAGVEIESLEHNQGAWCQGRSYIIGG